MSRIDPTSKMSLKMSCIEACNNDIDKATKLYEFISSGVTLPDIDPVRPSGIQQAMASADSVMGWIGQHRGEIEQGIGIIRSLRGGATQVMTPPDVPPIPTSL